MKWLADATLDHLRNLGEELEPETGKYRLLEAVGQGGMGIVYRALDSDLDREVALKVTNLVGSDTEGTDRLEREARILARLEHPGIVPVHDVGTLADGRLFYVMKLVRGDRLDRHAEGLDSLAERLRLFLRVCEPVAFAHAHSVLHRDLKPENVMVGPFGEVLVMDWGVARWTEEAAPRPARPMAESQQAKGGGTAAGTVLGTPGYMAPEQARGQLERIDERTDVYALGGLLRFLLTLGPPGADEEQATLEKAEPKLPRRLVAICLKARAPEREERYASVEAFAADVARFLDGLAVEAYREGPLDKLQRVVVKYKTPILLIAAYLVVRVLMLVLLGT